MEVVNVIGTRDLKTLLRAKEIIQRLSAEDEAPVQALEPTIGLARCSLEARLGRRRYLLEMLPDSIAYALPGLSGVFFVRLEESGRFELEADLPVVTQIAALELAYDERTIQVIHRSGVGFKDREYSL